VGNANGGGGAVTIYTTTTNEGVAGGGGGGGGGGISGNISGGGPLQEIIVNPSSMVGWRLSANGSLIPPHDLLTGGLPNAATQKRGSERLFQYLEAEGSDPEDYARYLHNQYTPDPLRFRWFPLGFFLISFLLILYMIYYYYIIYILCCSSWYFYFTTNFDIPSLKRYPQKIACVVPFTRSFVS